MCYLESHQREGHSSEDLTRTIDSLRAAGMEGVPARKGFMPVLTLALLSLISCAILDTQNDGLPLIGTALLHVAACTPKHSKEPSLFSSSTGIGMSGSVNRGWIFLSLFVSFLIK